MRITHYYKSERSTLPELITWYIGGGIYRAQGAVPKRYKLNRADHVRPAVIWEIPTQYMREIVSIYPIKKELGELSDFQTEYER